MDIIGRADIDVPLSVKKADELTKYATITRYPGPYIEVTEKDYRYAVKLAARVVKWSERIINTGI